MNYFENLVAIGVIAMTKKSMQVVVIKKEIGVGVSVSKILEEGKQEDRCGERKCKLRWEKKGIDVDEREESWSSLKVTNPKAFNSIVFTKKF